LCDKGRLRLLATLAAGTIPLVVHTEGASAKLPALFL
jgi:hypothetical protein